MYRGVCATCHSLNRIAFRNMDGVCYTTEELKEMASEVRRHMIAVLSISGTGVISHCASWPAD